MVDYTLVFYSVLAINCLATCFSSNFWKKYSLFRSNRIIIHEENASPEETSRHRRLMRYYLVVYLLATASDWLQGAYVYALYDEYGYSNHDIALLFVAGFGSSMIFGTFVGSLADWGGRRRFIIVYTIIYGASCITKHFANFKILIFGRILAGIATSLLFSVFDAWLIQSHIDANLGKAFLSQSFSSAAYGNAIVAILAGLVANKSATATSMEPIIGELVYIGGYLNPFDLAFVALILCALCCASIREDENTMEASKDPRKIENGNRKKLNWYDSLKDGFITTRRSPDILLCGIISSLFEGSMYIFVFMWTPALKEISTKETLPLGLIFSAFMVCCMAGSSFFSIFTTWFKDEVVTVGLLATATASMVEIAFGSSDADILLGMLVFEMTIGMYFPAMGILKGSIVPEDKRAAIYNLYRIPLNFIVIFSLLTHLTVTTSFTLNAIMLGLGTFLQLILMIRRLNIYSLSDCGKIFRHFKLTSAAHEKEENVELIPKENV